MNGQFVPDWRAWMHDPSFEFKEADFTGAPRPPEDEECVDDVAVSEYLGIDTQLLRSRWQRWKLPREGVMRWRLSAVEVWRRTQDPYRNHLR